MMRSMTVSFGLPALLAWAMCSAPPVEVSRLQAQEKKTPDKEWTSSKQLHAMGKLVADILNGNKLKLNGGLGGGAVFSSKHRHLDWSGYQFSNCSAAEADQAVRTLHQQLWDLIDENKWEVKGPRKLPAGEMVFFFELHFTAEGNQGMFFVTFTPSEGAWKGDKKVPCKLVIEASESATPYPLPAELVVAWKRAGATAGWVEKGGVQWSRLPTGEGAMPGLTVKAWEQGRLGKLPNPGREFGLTFSHITDAGLKELAAFKTLEALDLASCEVTDVGVKELAQLKSLKALSLRNTKVTDDCLGDLKKLKQLTTLDLLGTKVTNAGAADLQKAIPDLRILHSVSLEK